MVILGGIFLIIFLFAMYLIILGVFQEEKTLTFDNL